MKFIVPIIALLLLIGTGGAVKYVDAPDSDCGSTEFVSNATDFTIGGFGTGFDTFTLLVNGTKNDTEGIRVKIEKNSVKFQVACPDCDEGYEWKTIHQESSPDGGMILNFAIYNEVVYDVDSVHVSGNFKSADGKQNGLQYVTSKFKIDTTGTEPRTSYESQNPC